MSIPSLKVVRGSYSIEDPWEVPPQCERTPLVRAVDGAPPRVATTVSAYFDRKILTLVFEGEDSSVVATHLDHDAPLYEEDVVEAFLAPHDPSVYFEIEVNPLATIFDARVTSPEGVRSSMSVDRSWNCGDLFAAVKRSDDRMAVVIRMPFASLGAETPGDGDEWRANFFRIDRSREAGDEFLAWVPTMKSPPDFHLVEAFGRLIFAGG